MALTDEARAEIREAMRIIREDSFEKHARTVLKRNAPADPPTPPTGTPPPAPTGGPTPPPPVTPPADPPADPPKRRHAYWGELLTDD